MTQLLTWYKSADKNTLADWSGLVILFLGVALGVSVATALMVLGGILVVISTASSFYLTYLAMRSVKRGKS
jgi:hypothetical protein